MGFMSHRRRHVEVHPEQKWDFISLNDFKSTSCFTPFAYGYLWFSLFLSLAVYGVDTFTAVQLLAFNRWSSQIELTQLISFDIAKWIFSICIILSFINLGFEHVRARKIMNRGSVAESFLDSLAVRLESIRMGKGRGYKRFLVFAELTKSKKGAEIIALFTYFSFQSWIRIIVCSGPRQVVNALTLYNVYNVKLSATGNNFENSVVSFFDKIKALAMEDYRQAVILSGMLFTLVIWLFAFLSLLIAALFFVFFLWHYIPRDDGGLTGFCERKINKRLKQIVSVKINKAMAEDERKRKKAEMKAAIKSGSDRPMSMQATLPNLGGGDKLPEMPMLSRADTMMTLPEYSSRPGTPGSFELNALGQKKPALTRTATMASTTSQFSGKAPLIQGAAGMGMSGPESPAGSVPSLDTRNNYPPLRSGTMSSNVSSSRSYGSGSQIQRMPSNGSSLGGQGYPAGTTPYPSDNMPAFPLPMRSPVNAPNGYRGPGPNQSNQWPSAGQGRPPYDDYANGGRSSPAPSTTSFRSNPLSPQGMGPNGYPMRSATNPMAPRGSGAQRLPQRNMTAPVQGMHQPSASNSSLRNMVSQGEPYRQAQESGDFGYFNGPPTANSQRGDPRGAQPAHQTQASRELDYLNRPALASVQRSDSRGQPHHQGQQSGEFDYLDRTAATSVQRSDSRGQPAHQGQQSGDFDYPNRPATAGSQRNGPREIQPYRPQGSGEFDYLDRAPTTNSRPSPAGGRRYNQSQGSGEFGYLNRPATANSQRNGPRAPNGNGGNTGWNQDVERGNESRY
ncbi:hypothetical protein B0H67DRAFT_648281 [Lasiosphaeris hirsuta]|uniref:Pheromone-regulated membrane protein n=1 Tax=Lasiosphaeris hirsuta TaxID=260670 RepID=A0AA40A333_9PEZI|nr:hypothetical protein B0H67DRAFT_648281 [Lasiosphaeris hirsuta]